MSKKTFRIVTPRKHFEKHFVAKTILGQKDAVCTFLEVSGGKTGQLPENAFTEILTENKERTAREPPKNQQRTNREPTENQQRTVGRLRKQHDVLRFLFRGKRRMYKYFFFSATEQALKSQI